MKKYIRSKAESIVIFICNLINVLLQLFRLKKRWGESVLIYFVCAHEYVLKSLE